MMAGLQVSMQMDMHYLILLSDEPKQSQCDGLVNMSMEFKYQIRYVFIFGCFYTISV